MLGSSVSSIFIYSLKVWKLMQILCCQRMLRSTMKFVFKKKLIFLLKLYSHPHITKRTHSLFASTGCLWPKIILDCCKNLWLIKGSQQRQMVLWIANYNLFLFKVYHQPHSVVRMERLNCNWSECDAVQKEYSLVTEHSVILSMEKSEQVFCLKRRNSLNGLTIFVEKLPCFCFGSCE